MIAAIGQDRVSTSTTRAAEVNGSGTSFAATFEAMTAAAAPTSFTLARHSPAREDDRATTDSGEANRLDQAVAAFKKELSMTPAERVRRDVLKTINLTEEAIEALPPKERVEVEQKVAVEVARRMKVMQGGSAVTGPSTAGIGSMG